ncbi:TPA: hypothetical protein DEO28_02635 [Candidatus Dependentiae bacterium]|nr:MAG: hypothetical protein UR14_C0005G0116 [candidate division TM6 bacterium GW2011_GWE2_31_21]KKP53193.1 MAG: hypothetical protein UR43_C0007G0117 [candidate division TM6 bacterium GW2011_GWF2_33_332]HBS48011.1 hypothetical protein [Candidatus Dependentiae bacterium]HBZ73385.1 hypothetical protein [Candidatus Dependentiae bacterium]
MLPKFKLIALLLTSIIVPQIKTSTDNPLMPSLKKADHALQRQSFLKSLKARRDINRSLQSRRCVSTPPLSQGIDARQTYEFYPVSQQDEIDSREIAAAIAASEIKASQEVTSPSSESAPQS